MVYPLYKFKTEEATMGSLHEYEMGTNGIMRHAFVHEKDFSVDLLNYT